MAMRGGKWGAVEFPSLVGLLEHPSRGLVLYDTGYAPRFEEATRRFPECLYRFTTPMTLPREEELLGQLASRGIAPSDIGTVVISHFHADHVVGLRDFPGAKFLATRRERSENEGRGRLGRLRRAYLRALLPEDFEDRVVYAEDCPLRPLGDGWLPFVEAFDLFGDGSLLGIDLPGHVASQLGLAFQTEEEGAIFLVGDACWKIEALAQDRTPSRLAYSIFADGKAYDETFASLRKLHEGGRRPLIIPSHCDTTWKARGGTRRIHRA